jgi:hypothetical protein
MTSQNVPVWNVPGYLSTISRFEPLIGSQDPDPHQRAADQQHWWQDCGGLRYKKRNNQLSKPKNGLDFSLRFLVF